MNLRGKMLLLVGAVSFTALATPIDLSVTYRDFESDHPDFENAVTGVTPGMVGSNLGLDGNPVFVDGKGSVASALSFGDWYSDNPNHNGSSKAIYSDVITADKVGNTITFSDGAFFPLDTKPHILNSTHNYLFTMEMHQQFTYFGGESFDFTGDDDVWVFINGKLAMDLGGVHAPAGTTINLDALAGSLGISTGNTYDFDLFFAERHTTESNLKFQTNIQLQQVPEPATVSLLGCGLLGLLGLTVRRKRS